MSESNPLSSLDNSQRAQVDRMFSGCEEVIGLDHIISILNGNPSHSGDSQISAYIGLEPSGKAHLGWIILSETIKKLLNEDVNVIILLADWHAWVNDKFDRDMKKITLASDYMKEVFRIALSNPIEGDGPGQLKFITASEIMDSGKYWERVLRCSKNMSLSRVRRTFSIMGRDEDSSEHDLSAFYYPALQAADIFELKIDIAMGGMDQRKAHMYMREVADKNDWIKPTCIHTPMLSGLKGSTGRMDSFDHKMSKSNPSNAILVHDDIELLNKKLKKAFLEIGNHNSPIFEIARHIVLPQLGKIIVTPNPKYGDPSEWLDIDSFMKAIDEGEIHPFDAKMAISSSLASILGPIQEHFSHKSDILKSMEDITGQ